MKSIWRKNFHLILVIMVLIMIFLIIPLPFKSAINVDLTDKEVSFESSQLVDKRITILCESLLSDNLCAPIDEFSVLAIENNNGTFDLLQEKSVVVTAIPSDFIGSAIKSYYFGPQNMCKNRFVFTGILKASSLADSEYIIDIIEWDIVYPIYHPLKLGNTPYYQRYLFIFDMFYTRHTFVGY